MTLTRLIPHVGTLPRALHADGAVVARPSGVVESVWRHHALAAVSIYLVLTTAANLTALWLRFGGEIPAPVLSLALRMLPWLLGIIWAAFAAFGLHRSVWRFTGIWDLRDLVAAVALATIAFYLVVHAGFGYAAYPRSVFAVSGLLTIVLVGGARLAWRLLLETRPEAGGRRKRILIYGAGSAGEMIVRDLNKNLYTAIGFVDDDPLKWGQSIHRVDVLGGRGELARLVATESPDEVLVAMPSAGAAATRRIVRALEPFKVPITTLPPLLEIVDGKVTMNQVRRLAPEDLLPRIQVQLDVSAAGRLVEGRRVLVTGAGGSIGSELCRQILALQPEHLVLYERYENNLYAVLNRLDNSPRARAVLGDVTDVRRLHAAMRQFQPHVVFHAAAHKHVPLMELNPCEAVKNNVVGTRRVAEAAIQYGAERFVLISTDKAVNPSSLMGATKRVAELVVATLASAEGTRLATVRFGNVLGSNGSVVPRWLEQIAAGGPVTVTHPDVRRYFMLIPEAVQLILQAAATMRGGEIFALEMGEQIKLLEMARSLIRLSGFVPDEEIPISFVGLRPGEKLEEQLVGVDERIASHPVEKVLQLAALTAPEPGALLDAVNALSFAAVVGDAQAVVDLLCRIVPTYQPGTELAAAAREAIVVGQPAGASRRRTHDSLKPRPMSAPAARANGSLGTRPGKPAGAVTPLPHVAALNVPAK